MAIQAPNFAKDAVPTLTGWRHPKSGELLKSQRITQAEIDEFHGKGKEAVPVAAPVAAPVVAPVVEPSPIAEMNKVELEEYAREEHGVELDRRFKKSSLIKKVESLDNK